MEGTKIKNTGRKLLSVLLTLALMLSLIPAFSLTALAEPSDTHTHDDITFNEWTDEEAAAQYNDESAKATGCLPKSGSYYLSKDVKVAACTEITGTLNLCLNGHRVYRDYIDEDRYPMIRASGSEAALTLYDCGTPEWYYYIDDETHLGILCEKEEAESHTNHGSFTGGCISDGYSPYHGGSAVCAEEGASFTMHGGTLIGNNSAHEKGGAVYVAGGSKFTMYDGTIIGNYTGWYGGGVCIVSSEFIMHSGSISDNYADQHGGGVAMADSSLTMKSGKINGNSARDNGGGVYIETDDDNEFSLSGGEIQDNISGSNGGGVCACGGSFK